MKKNLTELVFILDRSGSLSGLEADTIGGFNAMIGKQKKAPGEALIFTILFDNVSEVIHDRVNVQDIRPMTDREYSVRGACACLLKDAADRNDESELRLPCGRRSSDYHYYVRRLQFGYFYICYSKISMYYKERPSLLIVLFFRHIRSRILQ